MVRNMDREYELIKIQVFADYCQARYNFFGSIFVGAIIGTLVVLVATSYAEPGHFAYTVALLLVVAAAGTVGMKLIMKSYNDDLDLLENLLSRVEKGESLPSLTELREMR
jgi:galactitol-specific phosphotransferase system IIC component